MQHYNNMRELRQPQFCRGKLGEHKMGVRLHMPLPYVTRTRAAHSNVLL